jgi:hypothetical protein
MSLDPPVDNKHVELSRGIRKLHEAHLAELQELKLQIALMEAMKEHYKQACQQIALACWEIENRQN